MLLVSSKHVFIEKEAAWLFLTMQKRSKNFYIDIRKCKWYEHEA